MAPPPPPKRRRIVAATAPASTTTTATTTTTTSTSTSTASSTSTNTNTASVIISNQWACDRCTFKNSNTNRHCGGCEKRKPVDNNNSSTSNNNNNSNNTIAATATAATVYATATATATAAASTDDGWSCAVCTLLNPFTHWHCKVCSTRRSVDENYSLNDDNDNNNNNNNNNNNTIAVSSSGVDDVTITTYDTDFNDNSNDYDGADNDACNDSLTMYIDDRSDDSDLSFDNAKAEDDGITATVDAAANDVSFSTIENDDASDEFNNENNNDSSFDNSLNGNENENENENNSTIKHTSGIIKIDIDSSSMSIDSRNDECFRDYNNSYFYSIYGNCDDFEDDNNTINECDYFLGGESNIPPPGLLKINGMTITSTTVSKYNVNNNYNNTNKNNNITSSSSSSSSLSSALILIDFDGARDDDDDDEDSVVVGGKDNDNDNDNEYDTLSSSSSNFFSSSTSNNDDNNIIISNNNNNDNKNDDDVTPSTTSNSNNDDTNGNGDVTGAVTCDSLTVSNKNNNNKNNNNNKSIPATVIDGTVTGASTTNPTQKNENVSNDASIADARKNEPSSTTTRTTTTTSRSTTPPAPAPSYENEFTPIMDRLPIIIPERPPMLDPIVINRPSPDLLSPMRPTGHQSVISTTKFDLICKRIYNLLVQYNVIRDPTKDWTSQIQPLEILTKTPQIYSILLDNKIGKSHYPKERKEYYQEDQKDDFKIMVSSGMIQPELDTLLVAELDDLVSYIIDDDNVPKELRMIFTILCDRGGDKLGLKKDLYYQLIEIACQKHHNFTATAEAFTCNENLLKQRRALSKGTVKTLMPILNKLSNNNNGIWFMLSWMTGADIRRLSSKVCETELIANGAPWEDALPFPVFENATSAEEIFSMLYTRLQKLKGRETVFLKILWTFLLGKILFLDKNELLFPNKELQKLLEMFGYKPVAYIYGGIIIIYVDPLFNSAVFLHSPLGAISSLPRPIEELNCLFMASEVLRLVVPILKGEDPFADDYANGGNYGFDCITASFTHEAVDRFWHLGRKAGCAITRDVITDDTTMACINNGLGKAKSSAAVAYRGRYPKKDTLRPVDSKKILEAINYLSYNLVGDGGNILGVLNWIHNHFGSNDNTIRATTVNKRWEYLIDNQIVPGTELQKLVIKTRDIHIKTNSGNTKIYDRKKDLKSNKAVLKKVRDGRFFWIRAGHPKTPEHAAIDYLFEPPDDGKIYVPSNNFTHQGIHQALKKKKTNNNTNHIKQYRPANKRVWIHEKLFYFRENPEMKPIHKIGNRATYPDGWIDSCTFFLCEMQEKKKDNPDGDVSEYDDDNDDDAGEL